MTVARQRQVHTHPHQQNTRAIGRQQPTYTSRDNRGVVGNDVFLCGTRIEGWIYPKLGLGTVTKKITVIQVAGFSRRWLLKSVPPWLGHSIVLWSHAGVSCNILSASSGLKWRPRQYIPPKRQHPPTHLPSVTTKKITNLKITLMVRNRQQAMLQVECQFEGGGSPDLDVINFAQSCKTKVNTDF